MAESIPPQYAKFGVRLGYPLDQLLHRQCRVLVLKPGDRDNMGILFTQPNDLGTGNIVIMGPPGSGKSTLGLHIALACAARDENRCYSAYFSLECTPQETFKKAKLFWPAKYWSIAASLPLTGKSGATIPPADLLYRLLVSEAQEPSGSQETNCPIRDGNSGPCVGCAACKRETRLNWESGKRTTWPKSAEPKVMLMSLAPRPTTGRADDHNTAFWKRYAQLESLLAASFELRTKVMHAEDSQTTIEDKFKATASTQRQLPTANWILPLMVIDSLNMMAEGMPSRDQLLPLFHLFRKYETTGVFLVESSTPTPFDSTLADVVIRLTVDEDQGYSARYFEVVKSRYRNQVNGRHPYKTIGAPSNTNIVRPPIPGRDGEGKGRPSPAGMIVLPSVHYAILRGFFHKQQDGKENPPPDLKVEERRNRAWTKSITDDENNNDDTSKTDEKDKNRKTDDNLMKEVGGKDEFEPGPGTYWGVNVLDTILPGKLASGSAVLVEGPSGTYKTNLAATFLAAGLRKGERVLLVRMNDDCMIHTEIDNEGNSTTVGPPISENIKNFEWKQMIKWPEPAGDTKTANSVSWQSLASPQKATITVWQHSENDAWLFEIDFKTGHLLAEEFIQFILDIVIRQPENNRISRVVLDDVSEIGVAYPFLRTSSTSGDILLPSFVHLMKDNHIDLVITGTTGIHPLADDAVARIRAVADTVLRTRYIDVFGRKHVVIEGEGQIASAKKADVEAHSVPAIIENTFPRSNDPKKRQIRVTRNSLHGLVGFDQGRLYRPGIALQLFQETGKRHESYNKELLAMMRAAFASPEGLTARQHRANVASVDDRTKVTLTPFGPDLSAAVHDGLDIFTQSEPMNGTVVTSVDEFVNLKSGQRTTLRLPEKFIEIDKVGGSQSDHGLFHYYKNVLLLAYKTDPKEPEWVLKSWKDLAGKLRKLDLAKGEFYWDQTASETLTCAFLDVLWPQRRSGVATLGELLRKRVSTGRKFSSELKSFSEVFALSNQLDGSANVTSQGNASDTPKWKVYLCWYSQLRELIANHDGLADTLSVTALPNMGFQGDWRIGVRSGSVSASLGNAVLNKLLSKTEDYKRFVQGVGLPCSTEIDDGAEHFLAWPLAQKEMTLRKVLDIHKNAGSRRVLLDYVKGRSALYWAAMQLVQSKNTSDAIDMVTHHLPTRVARLVSGSSGFRVGRYPDSTRLGFAGGFSQA